jgi:hypothetical protein
LWWFSGGLLPGRPGRLDPFVIAVNAESGIQDLQDLLVFCGPQAVRSLQAS